MVTITTEDPVAVAVVAATQAGDLEALRRLLAEASTTSMSANEITSTPHEADRTTGGHTQVTSGWPLPFQNLGGIGKAFHRSRPP